MPTKTDYILIGLGAFSAVLLTSYVPSLMKVMSLKDEYANCPICKEQHNTYPTTTENYMPTIDSVHGIDIRALEIARAKGLI